MLTGILERRFDSRPLALTRIVVGCASLAIAVETGAVLAIAARPGTVAMPAFSWLPPVSSNLAVAVFLVWSVAAVMLALGYGSRPSAALVAGCGLTALVVEQQAYSNHLMLMIALCLLLALADSGATWSIEARRGGKRPDVPFWPIALLMVQITTLYAFTALSKLNSAFLAGETMVLRSESSLSVPLGDFAPWAVSVMAISAVCVEGFLAVGLWHPRLRPAAFALGLTLHCGILVLLGAHLLPFAMLALSGYVLFLQPTHRVVVWHETRPSCSPLGSPVRPFGLARRARVREGARRPCPASRRGRCPLRRLRRCAGRSRGVPGHVPRRTRASSTAASGGGSARIREAGHVTGGRSTAGLAAGCVAFVAPIR